MADTSLQGAALRDVSWFMGFRHSLFPRVHPIRDFPYPGLLQLHELKKVRAKSKDIPPIWGVYVEYPLPTKRNGGGTVTGISSKMGGPTLQTYYLHSGLSICQLLLDSAHTATKHVMAMIGY